MLPTEKSHFFYKVESFFYYESLNLGLDEKGTLPFSGTANGSLHAAKIHSDCRRIAENPHPESTKNQLKEAGVIFDNRDREAVGIKVKARKDRSVDLFCEILTSRKRKEV